MSAAETKSYLIQPQYLLWNGLDQALTTGQFIGFNGSANGATTGNAESQFPLGVTITMDLFWVDVPVNDNTDDGATLIAQNNRINQFTLVIDQATGMFQTTGFNSFGNRTGTVGPGLATLYTQFDQNIDITACGARVTIT